MKFFARTRILVVCLFLAILVVGLGAPGANAEGQLFQGGNGQQRKVVTPAERQAAAQRAAKARQAKGEALQPNGASLSSPSIVGGALPTPDYFGTTPNYANSPLPASVGISGDGTGALAIPVVDPGTGAITAVTVVNGGTGYTFASVMIVGGGGTGANVTATITAGAITGFTVVAGGSGYNSVPGMRKFVDGLPGLTAAGANNLQQYIPVGVPDITTYPDSDYYEISLVEYTEKLHSDLPATKIRGYVQTNTTDPTVSKPSYLGPVIVANRDRPVRIKFTNTLPTGAGGDLFIPVDHTAMGAGPGPVDSAGNPCDWTMVGSNCAQYTENRATIHLHGGATPWISDGTTHQWTTPANENTPYPKGVSTRNVPDMPDPGPGSITFFYSNQQSARLMFYHDHAYGLTRLNVYAGEAAGYVLRDQVEQNLISTGIIPAAEVPLVIQDKTFVPSPSQLAVEDPTWSTTGYGGYGNLWFPHVYMTNQNPWDTSGTNAMGRWDYGPWFWPPYTGLTNGPVANPLCNPTCPPGQPPQIPGIPNPSLVPEGFMDTPLVNGTAYPVLTVDPKAYRLRILNASNDRFWNLQLYQAGTEVNGAFTPCSGAVWTGTTLNNNGCSGEVPMVPAVSGAPGTAGYTNPDVTDGRAGGVPDVRAAGPHFIQIGTEGGFLPAPVDLPNSPVGFNYNRRDIVVLNVSDKNLFLGPAERADVVVDFSQFAGKTLILYNDSPAPVPAFDPRYDYYTGNPDQTSTGGAPSTQPGYGPNTRTIMQIQVNAITPAPAYNLTALQNAFASTPTTPGVFAQDQHPIIVPQDDYNSAYNATYPATNVVRIQDTQMTFTPAGSATPLTLGMGPKAIQELFETQYGRMNATLGVELPNTNVNIQTTIPLGYTDPSTENLTDSITPMSPVAGDGTQLWKITHNGVDTHAIHFHLFDVQIVNRVGWDGAIRKPDPNELGWKDTVRMNPLEDAIVALRPIAAKPPFGVPNSTRSYDVTRPASAMLSTFNPLNGNAITVSNAPVNFGWEYVWHCHLLGHEENDMMRPMVFSVATTLATAPSLTYTQDPGTGAVTLNWTDATPPTPVYPLAGNNWGNPSNEVGFKIMRALLDGGGNPGTYSQIGAALANQVSYTDTTLNTNNGYAYQVLAYNVQGDSPSNEVKVGTTFVSPPLAPSGLTATLQTAPLSVLLSWTDNSTTETAFVVERSDNGGAFTVIASPAANPGTGAVTYTDNTVAVGNSYAYRVAATNAGGQSPYSNTATVSIAPAAPSGLTATLQTAPLGVLLSWTDNSTNETGFIVERSDNGGAFAQVATPAANPGTGPVTYTDTTVQPGNNYTYQVKSTNAAGTSTASNTASVAVAPAAPTGLTAVIQAGPVVVLNWVDPATNLTGFNVERSDNGGAFAQIGTTTAGTLTYTDPTANLTVGHVYTYQVKAVNAAGTSAASNTATASVTIPAAPTNLGVALQTTPLGAVLTWTDNATDETGFVLERNDNGAGFAQLATPAANPGTGTVTYTDTTVVVGHTYDYRVMAVNYAGNSAYSNTSSTAAPLTPSSLTATLQTGPSVLLSWTDNATNETGFVIMRADNGGTFTQIATPAANPGTGTVTYTDNTVANGNSYVYEVQAVNQLGPSAFSNTASVSIAPTAPSNLTAVFQPVLQALLTWTDNSTNETGFIVERSVNGGAFAQIATPAASAGTGTVTFTDTPLSPGTTYVYQVKSTNAAGTSAASNTATVVVGNVPAAPSNMTATLQAGPQVVLTWTDNATDETGFVLERAVNGGAFGQLTTFAANTGTGPMTYTDNTVTGNTGANTTYTYRIKAVNLIGSSAYATAPNVILAAMPNAPTNLIATVISATQIRLRWTDNANNETGFAIERSPDGVTFTQIATSGPNTTGTGATYNDTTVTAGNTYVYQVRAMNGLIPSAYTNTAAASTTAPVAPSNLTGTAARAGTTDTVTLNWLDASNNEVTWRIQRATDAAFTQNLVTTNISSTTMNATGGTITFTQTGLARRTTYYYRIRAINAVGNSVWTATFSITTP